MVGVLLVVFLVLHGLLHLAIWLPQRIRMPRNRRRSSRTTRRC